MSDATTSGWPYPVGTDRVMDGDDMMHATAALLEARVGRGFASGFTVISPPSAYDTPEHRKVAFPQGLFTAPPMVVVTLFATDPSRVRVAVEADDARPVTKDSFYIVGTRSSGPLGEIYAYWIAHQAGPSAQPQEGNDDE